MPDIRDEVETEAIHGWFGLTYSNYLVLPRTLLQSMPDAWQNRFVACLDELYDAFSHVEQAACYKVQPAAEREVDGLSDEELKQIGYSKNDDCDCYGYLDEGTGRMVHVPPQCPHKVTYYDDHGGEVPAEYRVVWPIGSDPVPHYNRGRTRIEPRQPAEASDDA